MNTAKLLPAPDASPAEAERAVEIVRRFIETNAARFDLIGNPSAPTSINRAGWRKGEGAGAQWIVASKTWHEEVCKGLDATSVARELWTAGFLERKGDRFSNVAWINGASRRVFVILATIIDAAVPVMDAPALPVREPPKAPMLVVVAEPVMSESTPVRSPVLLPLPVASEPVRLVADEPVMSPPDSASIKSILRNAWALLKRREFPGVAEGQEEAAMADLTALASEWGDLAEQMEWTAADLLYPPSANSVGGLIWALKGRKVEALGWDNARLDDGTEFVRADNGNGMIEWKRPAK